LRIDDPELPGIEMLDLSQSPGFVIRRLQQVAVSIFIESLRAHGVTPIQYTILRVARHNPGIDQASLAARSVLDTSTVMDVLRRLEARGLVERGQGLRDRRTRSVTLTREGAALLDTAEPQVNQSRSKLLAPLSAAERETLFVIVGKLLAAHEDSAEGAPNRPWRRLGGAA
jgi:DNA-binding MarR family transcriptional regulator